MTDFATNVKNLIGAIQQQHQRTHAGVVIAAAAILDQQLERALKHAMRPMPKKMYEQIFDSFRPLNSLSSKIVMAFALGVIEKEIYDELEKIRKIRNVFAHSSEELHFGSKEIAPLFAELKAPQSKSTKPVLVFLGCVEAVDDALEAFVMRTEEGPPP